METVTRSGTRTSEFWLVIAFFGTVILNGTAFVAIPTEHMTMLAAAAFGYTGGRQLLKTAISKNGTVDS